MCLNLLIIVLFAGLHGAVQNDGDNRAIRIALLKSNKWPTDDLFVSKAGQYVAASSMGNELAIWERKGRDFHLIAKYKTAERVRDLQFRETGNLAVVFKDDGRVLFQTMKDGMISRSGTLVHELGENIVLKAMAKVSPSGSHVAYNSAKDTALEIWQYPITNRQPERLFDKEGVAHFISFSSDETKLAVANEDNVIRIWNMKTRKLVRKIAVPDEGGPFFQLTFSEGNRRIAVAHGVERGWGLACSVHDLWSGSAVRAQYPSKNNEKVKGVVFSKDLRRAFSCDNEGGVFEQNLYSKKRSRIYCADEDLRSIAISPQGDLLFVGGWSGTVTVLSLTKD